MPSVDLADVADHILSQPHKWIVTPDSLSKSQGISQADAKKVLFQALKAGILVPVYRVIGTEKWTPKLNLITQMMVGLDSPEKQTEPPEGSYANVKPQEIEVAFMRTTKSI